MSTKAKARTDTTTLVEVVNRCFDLAMDGRLRPRDRKQFLALGKRLRGSLLNLLTAMFDESSEEFKSANAQISAVNRELKAVTARLEKIAATVENVARLVQVLDDLLKIASSFV